MPLIPPYPERDHKDSVLYMMLRREINEEHAEHPLDFNAEGLLAGQKVVGRPFTPEDTIVDIGSSSGRMIAQAALSTEVHAGIICIEPDVDARNVYRRLEPSLRERVTFLQATGEHVPLRDSSVQGATLHNVIFRARDAAAMLQEAKRIVEPGGFIAISSNARGHAIRRHSFERLVAQEVMRVTGATFTEPEPPAEGHYIEDLPSLVSQVGGLAIINELYVAQDSRAIITPGESLADYLDSLKYSAANTDLPDKYRSTWRQVVQSLVLPIIETEMGEMAGRHSNQGNETGAYFSDPIQRGMLVLQNQK